MGDDGAPGVFMLPAIRAAIDKMPVPRILQEIGDGFVSYSKGEVIPGSTRSSRPSPEQSIPAERDLFPHA